ncbi:unnamed protein product [Blepharisma stoltei]|uniref:Uncharacterized protein n=1 Tax=Blepharisma stoltei TaxID=1481888 RepID=A0AAU9JPG4_9CILI|nr:unnamed protein product [Blepharisma stoltei]
MTLRTIQKPICMIKICEEEKFIKIPCTRLRKGDMIPTEKEEVAVPYPKECTKLKIHKFMDLLIYQELRMII